MTDPAAARRMRLLELLRCGGAGRDLAAYAREFDVDERTIRRDVDYLQEVLGSIEQVGLRRGLVYAARTGHGPGYFAGQLEHRRGDKEAIATAVVDALEDNQPIALTAGSTTFHVARELRRRQVDGEPPHGLIVFTNSLPALAELVAAGVSTGVIGEVYNADDSAFHAHEFHSAFQSSLAVVGASGVLANPASGSLELYSHRAEEAAFLKQLLAPIPELFVAVDASKLGHRHPWSFTSGGLLAGKTVRLFTSTLDQPQRDTLGKLAAAAHRSGYTFTHHESEPVAAP
jgi:DeoR/GlpR family transcriptional regulator of sugar metabolism